MSTDGMPTDRTPTDVAARTRAALTDPERLRDVAAIDLDHPELRRRLDEIAARTRHRLGLEVGLVTVVLDCAQLVVGSAGLEGWIAQTGGTPAEWAFCAQLVGTGRPYVVEDASGDDLQKDNPLVTIDGVRSYLGVPLVSEAGHVVGGHCVLTFQPRHYTDADLAELTEAAQEIDGVIADYRRTLATG